MQRWETTGYVTARPNLGGKALWFDHEWGPKSVITRPSGGQVLDRPGYYQISGLAWSGAGSVRRVEVSTDGGRTWKDAEIEGPVHRKAHTRFRMDWTWKGGGAELQSRCTDDQGNVQPSQAELAKLIGAPGPEWFKNTGIIIHDNHIQPWRIDRDGTVQEFDPMEVDLVRSVLPQARKVILVAHDEKFERRAPHVVTQMADVDVLITNGDPASRFDDPATLASTRVIALG